MNHIARFLRLFPFALCLASSASAQLAPDEIAERTQAVLKSSGISSAQVVHDLVAARRAGDVTKTHALEKILFGEASAVQSTTNSYELKFSTEIPADETGPQWGNDVKIYTGNIFSYGKRQVATDYDTVGGIYAAFNAVFLDTLSRIMIYRSTNGGKNWTSVFSVWAGNKPMQSFDMCVTDSAGGVWIIGIAAVVKSDKSSAGGGDLWWISVHSDGTGFRATQIQASTASMGFRNPTICTDGALYAPASTYHYIAAEYISPGNDSSRGLYVRRSTTWGKTWGTADTTLRGYREGTPSIGISWGTSPDSLLIAFSRTFSTGRAIRVASNSLNFTNAWSITYPSNAKDDYDPAMALNSTNRQAIITYTRYSGPPTYSDAMYLYSNDMFQTFTRDSIAVTTNSEDLTSASYAPWSPSYYFRVAYHSTAGTDSICYKALYGTMSGFYTQTPTRVNQYQPSGVIAAAVGADRDIGGNAYRGNVLYIGYGPANVYFDAVDLALDVPLPDGTPLSFGLDQNYPNPFNPSTTIVYSIPVTGNVRLTVFDLLGREVQVLVNDHKDAGKYSHTFDASSLASGMYVYRLQAGDHMQARKLLLLR